MRFANSDENFADDPEGGEVQVYQAPLELFKLLEKSRHVSPGKLKKQTPKFFVICRTTDE